MKFKSLYIFILFSAVAIIATSCYYDNEEVLYPPKPEPCDTTNVTYSNSVKPIFESYCYSCHSNTYKADGGNIRLDNYNDIQNSIDRIEGALNHDAGFSAMPKNGGKLSNCRIRTVSIWIDGGAPNN